MIHFFRRSASKPTATIDQADRLRDLVRGVSDDEVSAQNHPPIIVLAGSKGGVGVTTLTAALARAFKALGHEPLAVDANLRQADLGQLLGTPHPVENDIADVIAGRCTASEAIITTPGGIRTLPGSWAPATQVTATPEDANLLVKGLTELPAEFDILLIDAGAGFSPTAASLWRRAAKVLLVTTAGELSVLGAYATIKLARAEAAAPPIALLANRSADEAAERQILSRVQATCQKFLGADIPIAGRVDKNRIEPHAALHAQRLAKALLNQRTADPRPQLQAA